MSFEPSIIMWGPATIAQDQFWANLGVISFNNSPSLVGVTSFTHNGTTTSEAIDLEDATDLVSFDCPNMVSITGGGYIFISGSPSITELSGFNSLITGHAGFTAQFFLDGLTTISGFNSLETFGSPDDFVLTDVFSTPSLNLVSGFNGPLAIARDLVISGYGSLTDISGFQGVITIPRHLNLSNNAALAELTGFEALSVIGGNLIATGCALSATAVNKVLALLVAATTDGTSPWANTVNLSGGTSAAPSGQGITDAVTLTGRGATVTTN